MDMEMYTLPFTFEGSWDELFDVFAESVTETRTATLYDQGSVLEVFNGIDLSKISTGSESALDDMLAGTEYVGRLEAANLYAKYAAKPVGGNRYAFTFEGYVVSFYRGMSEKPFEFVLSEDSEDTINGMMEFAEDLLLDTKRLGYMY